MADGERSPLLPPEAGTGGTPGSANPHGPRGEEVREVSVQLPVGVQGGRPAHRLPPRVLQTHHLAVSAPARRPRPRGAPCRSARVLRPLRGPLPVGGAPGALAGALSPLPEGLGHWRAVPAGAVPALPPPRAPIGRGGCWAGGGHVGPRPALPANPRGLGGAGGGGGGVSAARGLLGLRAGQQAPPPPRLTPPTPGGHLGSALPGRSAPFGGHFRLGWATEEGTSGAHGGPHRKALPVQCVLSDRDFRSGSHLGLHAPPPRLGGHLGLAPPPCPSMPRPRMAPPSAVQKLRPPVDIYCDWIVNKAPDAWVPPQCLGPLGHSWVPSRTPESLGHSWVPPERLGLLGHSWVPPEHLGPWGTPGSLGALLGPLPNA